MKKALGFMIISLGLAAAGCGSSSSPGNSSGTTTSSGGGVALAARDVKGLGTVLVNGQGRTLYVYAPDKAKKVTCTGSCATVWPPLKSASGQKASVSGAVKASLVASASDPSGGSVVTYNGWPLYLYAADAQAGTDHGQALFSSGGYWYAITPAGTVIKKKVKQTTGPTGY